MVLKGSPEQTDSPGVSEMVTASHEECITPASKNSADTASNYVWNLFVVI